jgi:hypothetical protein
MTSAVANVMIHMMYVYMRVNIISVNMCVVGMPVAEIARVISPIIR